MPQPPSFSSLDQAPGSHFVCFRRINQVQAEDVFIRACAHVKTVTVIRRVRNESAILKHGPLLPWTNSKKRGAKNRNANERDCRNAQKNRRARDQTGTSNWLINLNVSQRFAISSTQKLANMIP
jgi:hypothetical protein